ncbi:MAG: glycosyltransferase family 2 protein, partial [Spirochaetota bacterium]
EELNLENCLKNIFGWADEIFIVDNGSTDKTAEIARSYEAQVIEHRDYKNQAQQFNWALDNLKIKNEWILRLDADEYLTDELKHEITETLKNTEDDITGYYMKRRVYFMGKWIKYGGYYPTWILRLFKKNKGKSEEREMDEHIILFEGKAERLKNDFVDDNRKSLESWIFKHNDFSTREARERLKGNSIEVGGQAGRKRWLKRNLYLRLPIFLRSFLYFIYRYFFRLGFLDGKEGLIFHFLQGCWHQFLIDAKIYERLKHKEKK